MGEGKGKVYTMNAKLDFNIYKELLIRVFEVESVNLEDSLISLGCSSLNAIELEWEIEKSFGKIISLESSFTDITVGKLWDNIQNEKIKNENIDEIHKVEKGAYYNVSSVQKRLYTLYQFDKLDTSYVLTSNRVINGEFDVDHAVKCIHDIVDRHEILRINFGVHEGEVVMYVHDKIDFTVDIREEKSIEDCCHELIKPFVLEMGPLLHVTIVKENEKRHGIMLVIHHIIADGTSTAIFWDEFFKLYFEKELEEIEMTYKDFAAWQNEYNKSEDVMRQKEYWINEFKGDIQVLNLPTSYPRPSIQNHEGDKVRFTLSEEVLKRLRCLVEKTNTTMYILLLAIFNVFLFKYSRQEDIIVGSPIAGRKQKNTSRMIGMFVNTIAIRNYPEGTKKFVEFLYDVKVSCINAFANQEYQYEDLVNSLDLVRDTSRNPIFDVAFAHQTSIKSKDLSNRYDVEAIFTNSKSSRFDLTLAVTETDRSVFCNFEYCTKLFKRENIERMIEHFCTSIDIITANPQKRLDEIEMITEGERQKVLYEFNDTASEFHKGKTIVELFEEQVKKTPNNIAVVFMEEKLTYAELNCKANKIAYKLREKGIKPNDFVVIIAERSIEMIVGIYGILKSGGAYVPIDPTYPKERRYYMLEDCRPKAVLVYKTEIEITNDTNIEVINLEDERLQEYEEGNLEKVNSPNDLAYLIYTSGTTGKPKGVMIEHVGIVNLKQYFISEYQIGESDTVLQYANIIFDAATWEISMGLLTGAKLVIVEKEAVTDVAAFNLCVSKNNISIATLPTQFYRQVNNFSPRLLFTAGAASDSAIVAKTIRSEYVNAYGPTESTICATTWRYSSSEPIPWSIPIGKPITNTKIYIMKDKMICGIGIPGELCIAGEGIGRGYLNQPNLTAERFVENPYGPGKIYRSGDLGRWKTDGNIEFLGRIDDQVKIRGYRIELGEIESCMLEHPKICNVAVIALEHTDGLRYISAYFVSREELILKELKQFLLGKLPDYMVPERFVRVDAIPVTRNGKVDRRALQAIKWEVTNGDEFEEAVSNTEKVLAEIWSEVLGRERISINDNFFDTSGNSLKAIMLIHEINCRFNVEESVSDIIQAPTIKKLAVLIDRAL